MAEPRPYRLSELTDPDFVPAFFRRRTTRTARETVLRRLIATAIRSATCDREHVELSSGTWVERDRFFGDENNG